MRRLEAFVHDGLPVTLSIRELGPDDAAIELLEKLCLSIRRYLGADKALLSRIGLSVHSHQLPLQAYLLISRTLLGDGPRYVLMDSLQMQYHKQARVQEETERNWLFLWRQRGLQNSVMPAYGAAVRTACPLLGDEVSEAVLPLHGVQVPAAHAQ